MKKISLAIISLFSISFLAGCTTDNVVESNNQDDSEIKVDDQENINTTLIDIEPLDTNPPQLAINSACIGCGKCWRIDPAHFELNSDTKKAIIVSQDNLESVNLLTAIDICPVEAISI